MRRLIGNRGDFFHGNAFRSQQRHRVADFPIQYLRQRFQFRIRARAEIFIEQHVDFQRSNVVAEIQEQILFVGKYVTVVRFSFGKNHRKYELLRFFRVHPERRRHLFRKRAQVGTDKAEEFFGVTQNQLRGGLQPAVLFGNKIVDRAGCHHGFVFVLHGVFARGFVFFVYRHGKIKRIFF